MLDYLWRYLLLNHHLRDYIALRRYGVCLLIKMNPVAR